MSDSGENQKMKLETVVEAKCQDGPSSKKQKLGVEDEEVKQSSVIKMQSQCAEGSTKPNDTNEETSLRRKEFTSEIYKIELLNVSRNCGYNELKKLVNNKLRLNGHKFKLTSSSHPQVFVNFKNETDKNKALAVLNGYSFRGQVMTAKHAEAAPDPLIQRQQQPDSLNDPKAKIKSDGTDGSTPQSIEKLVIDATTPWACHTYSDQVQRKQGEVLKVMKQLTRESYRANAEIDPHIKRLKDPNANYDTLICDMDEILKSPVVDGYRNKSEFTIGVNPDSGEPTVGFRIASYNQGSLSVGPIDNLRHLSPAMIQGALAFQSFVRKSNHLPYDPASHKGVWKQLTVRTTQAGELMLYVLISVEELETDDVDRISSDLKSYFQSFDGFDITSFYIKISEKHGVSEKNQPSLVFGKPTITEDLFGLQFRISPDAFFQVNTKTTEIMYSTISSMAQLDNETTLLDVCCGTGTIGLSCLKLGTVGEVLGVDWTPAAILDAKLNASANGLEDQCGFFCGKAEDLLSILIGKAKFPRVVAIVDPPRSGLHSSVIHILRNTKRIKSLIYVACNAKSAMQNFIDLAKPVSKRFRGEPFKPIRALPVDMFPHTPHFELILVMKRMETKTEEC